MTFPESERVVYQVHTLAQVACQLNFPTILSIGTDAPSAFQDQLRETYPLYEPVQVGPQLPEIADLIARLPIKPPISTRHQFTTADGQRSVSLSQESLIIAENSYDQWPTLRQDIETARSALEEIYRPAFYTRVGLRYQDAIDQRELGFDPELPWAELINPALTSFLGAAEPAIKQAVIDLTGNALVSLDGAPDAMARIMYGTAQREPDNQVVYLVDADYFTNERKQGGEVLELLDYFNKEAGQLFRWAITDRLRDALGRRDDVAVARE
jgi:uncharacterized protein (TIGR04255 family)